MKMTVKIYDTIVIIDDGDVICDDETLKGWVEYELAEKSYGPEHGFYPGIFKWFKDAEVIAMDENEDEIGRVY